MIKDLLNKDIRHFNYEKVKTFGFYVLLFLLSASIAIKSVNYDFDLWARLIAGMAVVQTGHILKYDFLSYTPTHAWYDHEWGSSVVFYLFKDLWGHVGLLLLQVLLMFLTMVFLVKTVKLRFEKTCNCQNVLFYFLILNSFTVTYSSLIRCHSFTFLFFAIELYLLELIRKNNNYKLLFIFPFMFLIWGNMHGGVVSGLGLLAMYTLGEALNKKPFKHYLIATIVCPLMLFINPYGVDFVKFLIKATTMPRPDVVEWWPIFTKYNAHLFLTFKIMALVYLIIEFVKVKKDISFAKLDKTKFVVMAVTLVLAVMRVKMMPFFTLAGTIFCYKDVMDAFNRFTFPKWCMPTSVIFLSIYSVLALSIKDYRPMVNYAAYPVMEIEFIKNNHLDGKILTNFGIGSFASYKLYPQNKIYMDGRYEEVYDDYLLEDLGDFYAVKGDADALMRKNRPDVIIMEKSYPKIFAILKQDPQWSLAFEGINFGVFVDSKKAKKEYIPPSGDLKYYKKTILNTAITFKGDNRVKIEEVNKRGDK